MQRRIIRVRGKATASAQPDWVVISLEVGSQHRDFGRCTGELAHLTETLRQDMERVGVDRDQLKTGHLSVSTSFDYQDQKRVFVGYEARHSLTLEFDLQAESLNRVLKMLGQAKSRSKFTVRFSVKDPEPVRDQALEEAVKKAREKARLLAKASGVSLGELLEIDLSWSDIYIHSSSEMIVDSHATTPGYDITPEDVDFEESVNLVWQIV